MNLLNQRDSKSNGKIETEIFQILEEAKISNENKKIAIEFFDFSKEMNLELLEHVTFQDMSQDYVLTYHAKQFFSRLKEKDSAYADQYILFLDAIGFHTIGKLFSYNMLYEERVDNIIMKRLSHAFSIKYSPKMAEAKIITLLAEERPYVFASEEKYYGITLINIAKENPMSLIRSAKYCYHSSYKEEKLKSYALGLAYTEPAEENRTIFDAEEMADIKDGIAMIREEMENSRLAAKDEFESRVSASFMAMHHDEKIKELLEEKIHKKEHEFLTAILKYVPNSYIEKNIDILFELLHLEISSKKVYQCVKAVLHRFGLKDSNIIGKEKETNPEWLVYRLKDCNIFGKENVVLAKIAEMYPEQYIEAMRSTERMESKKSVVVGNYYENMYQILEKVNPESIKTYQVDFDSELLRLAAESEKKKTKQCKEEVFRYLCGENDDFTSEKEYEQLHETMTFYVMSDVVESCIRHNALFKKRYCALKAVQKPNILNSMLTQEESDSILLERGELVDILVSEKVPIMYRFETYEIIAEYYVEEKKKEFEMELAKAMSVYGKEWDEEYEAYCKKGEIFTRKVCLRYLELSNHNDACKDKILAFCGDSSKEVRTLAGEIIAKQKEYEEDVINLLKARKQAVRETAVDILSIWGANHYRKLLLKAAENEKNAKLAEKMCRVLDVSDIGMEGEENPISPAALVENLHRGGRNKKILWLYETPNQTVHFTNGKEADEKYMQAILLCYANMSIPGINKNAEILAKMLKQRELEQYSAQIFSKWLEKGAEAKQKWVLYFAAIHGGHDMVEKFLTCIKEWAEKSRGAIAGEAVKALALNGSAEALMHVDNMAHKFKHKQVKNAALQALDYAAEELGITSDELGDRIVPDLGFGENMERIFDYGKRKFKVYLTPALELEIFDEDGKKRKTLPAPSKKDEEETAKQSNTEFKQMKKQLKSVIAMQKLRLETALLADRRWTVEAWQNLFVKNPVMHSFAIGLIWAAYEENQLVQTFRYMEDGSFNTSDEEEYELSANASIGLVHPIDLREEELSAWKEQLCDYEITQPIEQLERKVYHISEEEKGIFDLTRFKGRQINGMTLLGRMTKLGWYKGSVQDAGGFCTFYREDVVQRIKREDGSVQLIGNAVEFNFSGMYVAGEDEEVELENVRFYTPGTVKRGSYEYDEADDEKAIKLDEVNPRYFSEIINQLEVVLKGTE